MTAPLPDEEDRLPMLYTLISKNLRYLRRFLLKSYATVIANLLVFGCGSSVAKCTVIAAPMTLFESNE